MYGTSTSTGNIVTVLVSDTFTPTFTLYWFQPANIVFEADGKTFHVVDWTGVLIIDGDIGDETRSAVSRPASLVGTPSYQPFSVAKEGTVSPLTDIYAACAITCQVMACEGEVLHKDGGTTLAISMLHNKVGINGLGTLIGGTKHQARMKREEEERDWKWRVDSRPHPIGVHFLTKILGVFEANRNRQLQSLNVDLSFPIATVHKVFGNGEGREAAEKLLHILVYRGCSLKEGGRDKGLDEAILAARALVHCSLEADQQ